MLTILEYLVIAAVIGAAVFAISIFIFGRGEQMAPLPARTSPSELPEAGLVGDDVRHVRFGLALRGYRMSDVDWTLDRLADEIDRLREELAAAKPGSPLPETFGPGSSALEPDSPAPAAVTPLGQGSGAATARDDGAGPDES